MTDIGLVSLKIPQIEKHTKRRRMVTEIYNIIPRRSRVQRIDATNASMESSPNVAIEKLRSPGLFKNQFLKELKL